MVMPTSPLIKVCRKFLRTEQQHLCNQREIFSSTWVLPSLLGILLWYEIPPVYFSHPNNAEEVLHPQKFISHSWISFLVSHAISFSPKLGTINTSSISSDRGLYVHPLLSHKSWTLSSGLRDFIRSQALTTHSSITWHYFYFLAHAPITTSCSTIILRMVESASPVCFLIER